MPSLTDSVNRLPYTAISCHEHANTQRERYDRQRSPTRAYIQLFKNRPEVTSTYFAIDKAVRIMKEESFFKLLLSFCNFPIEENHSLFLI